MTLNSEWDRVKDNPDNLIVSDSLRDLLDPEAFGPVTSGTNPKGIRLVSKLIFTVGEDESTMSGAMLSFTRGTKEWCYVFEMKAELLAPILMAGSLVKIEVTDQNESFKHELELLGEDPGPTVAFELNTLSGDTPATTALLTVTVAAPA